MLLVALCQGAALHYLDGLNGFKDLDVWTFYARHPEGAFPPRWRVMAYFGRRRWAVTRDDTGFLGRHVDLIGRSLDVAPGTDPVRAVRSYLRAGRTASARALAAKAVVAHHRGRVARGISAPGSHRSRRNRLQLPGSCHPDHQTAGAEAVHFQCANIRGYRWTIPRQHRKAFVFARSRLYLLRIQRIK